MAVSQNISAVIFDFDDTLTDDARVMSGGTLHFRLWQ